GKGIGDRPGKGPAGDGRESEAGDRGGRRADALGGGLHKLRPAPGRGRPFRVSLVRKLAEQGGPRRSPGAAAHRDPAGEAPRAHRERRRDHAVQDGHRPGPL
ncbi:MAG: hypothetical protein AVDCRST_MAG25-293, partial [uncultured Rubrobacteraceae bacterium]